jgi:hypothetical protein
MFKVNTVGLAGISIRPEHSGAITFNIPSPVEAAHDEVAQAIGPKIEIYGSEYETIGFLASNSSNTKVRIGEIIGLVVKRA